MTTFKFKLHPRNLIIHNEADSHLGHFDDMFGPFYVWDMLESYYSDMENFMESENGRQKPKKSNQKS